MPLPKLHDIMNAPPHLRLISIQCKWATCIITSRSAKRALHFGLSCHAHENIAICMATSESEFAAVLSYLSESRSTSKGPSSFENSCPDFQETSSSERHGISHVSESRRTTARFQTLLFQLGEVQFEVVL